jgi:mono/diheme cytochrome c family protein
MKRRSLIDRTCRLLALCAIGVAFMAQHRGAAASYSDFFKEKVAPIFERSCVMCHGAGVQRSGLDQRGDGEQSILKGGARGPAVVPGNAEKSLLYRLITHKEEPAMPMGMEKLGDADVAAIAQWINGLSPKAAMADETIPTRQPGYSITEKDRQFWSFVKPLRPAPPKVKDRRWIRNEVDVYVLSRLEKNGLRPNRAATPRELLRRVYFDLIGLPPSPEEMAGFLKNPSEAAYAKVVDRLLASQHYGERWGRHWLDLARYADSGGYEFACSRPARRRRRESQSRSSGPDRLRPQRPDR